LISIKARHAEKAFGSSEESRVMLLLVTCPNCRYVGATTATLPRVLVCSACGQSALIKEGEPPWSPVQTRAERAAAWTHFEAANEKEKAPPL
jgi:hypothetical protein